MAEVFNPSASLEHDTSSLTGGVDSLYRVVRSGLKQGRKVHFETAISTCGFLAGVTVLRQCGASLQGLKPGTPIDPPAIDQMAVRLIDFMRGLCAEASLGREGGWMDPIPNEHRPNQKMADLISKFEPQFHGVVQQAGIDKKLWAGVAASTAIRFMKEGATTLHVDIGKALAAHAVVRAAKTVPPALLAPVKPSGKPWWKVW